MGDALLAVVRCGCGGRVGRRTEQTTRGLRWAFACEGCGARWGHRDGAFGPLDGSSARGREGGTDELAADEAELLGWFRCLAGESRAEVMAHVRMLAVDGQSDRTRMGTEGHGLG